MITQRKRLFVTAAAAGALLVLAGMSLATISAPIQEPAFRSRDPRIATGPEVTSPGSQRLEMIRLLQSIDGRMTEQNKHLAGIQSALNRMAANQ